ncbi:MAG: TM2 domain-containing protein [Coprobacter sp.]|nr:TM2 domain-containing protein [Coprobacter sp.]
MKKNKNVAAVLAFFVGGLGIHKFYLGKPLQGVLYLVFCWSFVPAVVAFVEAITYFVASEEEFDRKYNR